MRTITSSQTYNSISIRLFRNIITITNIPSKYYGYSIMIYLVTSENVHINKQVFLVNNNIKYSLRDIPDGKYQLNVYLNKPKSNLYWSYYRESEIIIILKNNQISYETPKILEQNKRFYNSIRKDSLFISICRKPSQFIQSDNPLIMGVAKSITQDCILSQEKVLTIHDWVASNICYDYDSFKSGNYVYEDSSALGTFLKRRGVCQGYSNLFVAMLRSIKIPAIGILCFALGINSYGDWNNSLNITSPSNHIFPAVFIGGRWILIDVTWNSDTYIENGTKGYKTGWGVSHKYYDSTIDFISKTHRLNDISI